MDAAGTTNRRKRQRASSERETKGPNLRKRSKKSFKEPPASQDSDEAQWWSVQTVLDERKRPGRPVEYKVLWDPHPQTGETYEPTWEPAAHLTADLLVEWKQKSAKSGDQADGVHVEPRSQAAYVPGVGGGDSSLDTGVTSASNTPNRSALRRRDPGTRNEDFSASPASSIAPSSPRRTAPPNQSQQLDPESQEPTQHTAESGENLHSERRKSNTNPKSTTFVEIENDTAFPRDDYQGGLSQRADFVASQTQPDFSNSLGSEVRSRATTPESSAQPFRQPADARTPRVIPDSQSQGGAAPVDISSPIQGYFDTPGLPQQTTSPALDAHFPTSYSKDKSSAPVPETDPIESTSLVAETNPYRLRSATQSPVKNHQLSPRRTASPVLTQSRASTPRDSSRPLIGPGSLRSASKTPKSVQLATDSANPSPLRSSRVASPSQAGSRASETHQEIFQSWGAASDHPLVSSHDFAGLLQSTRPENNPPSSSIPEPPSHDPETLASQPPPLPESFTMPGTRRSQRSDAATTASPSAGTGRGRGRGGRRRGTGRGGALTSNPQIEDSLKDVDPSDRESDLDDKIETGVNSSTESLADGEIQSQAISAERHSLEPVMDHDALGNSRLAARIPGEADDDAVGTDIASPPEIRLEAPVEDTADSDTESEDVEDQGPPLGQMEFIVPLPFAGQARDQYRKTIKYNESLIEKFTGRKWSDPPTLLSDAQTFVQTMRDITTHIDLTNDTAMSQTDIHPSDVIEWDRSVSTKFKLLYDLLSALREEPKHVVVITRAGRAQDILDNFLKGMGITYSRLGNANSSEIVESQKPLLITTLASDLATELPETSTALAALPPTALVIAFDAISDELKRALQTTRQDTLKPEKLAPLISLAVINSIDHIDHSVAPMFKGTQRLRIMVNCLVKLRKEAGRDDIGLPAISEVASDISQFVLQARPAEQWPLPPIGTLSNNDAWDLSQGLVSMKSNVSSDSEKSAKAKAAAKKSAKRPIDRIQDEEGAESSKKMRMTPQPEQDISETRISDSTAVQSTETQKQLAEELAAMQELLKATEEQLKISNESSGQRIHALEGDIGELQFRFEEQTAEKRALLKELSEAQAALEVAGRQRESRDATIDKLKEEIRNLKAQLSEAHVALEGSQIPEVAAMEKLRQEKEQAEVAQRRAEKAAANQESTLGYARQQLEEARGRAIELQEQNNDYESRFAILERQATGEISKARQMFLDERAKNESAENLRLKQENRNLQQLLQRKEEELKSRRSGMGTRAGSVPRSPRVGPASRAGSPIPDRRIGALKNHMMQGRRQPKAKQQQPHDDSAEASKIVASSTPVIQEPKPRRPVELKNLEAKQLDGKAGADSKTADQLPVPRAADVRTQANNSRPFPCVFAQYNCGSAFTSKNEWKRHISTKHIQLGFWRCDMCPPSPGIDHPVYNDFNRKDLFTQHLRRMHAMSAPATLQENATASQQSPGPPPSSASSPPNLTEEQITEIQKRCYRQLRAPPDISSCVFCSRTFQGPNSWEERLEHVGGHLERDRKHGQTCLDVASWRPDPQLRDYLVTEGLVEIDPRGGYRIGDGKPKRPLDIEGFAGQAPTAQLTPRANVAQDSLAASAAGREGGPMDVDDSESSTGKRRRGRPPKRLSDAMDIDIPAATAAPPPLPPQQPAPTSQPIPSPTASQHFRQTPPGPPPQPMHHQQQTPGHSMPPSPGRPPNHQLPPGPPHLGPPILQGGPPPHMLQHHGPPPPQGQLSYPGPPPPHHMQQSPRDGGPPPYPGQPGAPPISPRQYQLPPANLQNMYKFEHGSFTKFAGTTINQWPPVVRPPQTPEYPPPGLSARAPGQPQLAPKPAPDPVQEIMSRIYANAPQLAPKPLGDMPPVASGREAMSPRPASQGGPPGPPAFHSGFRPINETSRPGGPVPVAPKPSQGSQGERQEGGRQLAPKPPSANMPVPQPFPPYTRESQPPPLIHHGPPHQQHHPQHLSQPASEPHTPGPQPPQHPLHQGPGPHLAPAPSPSAHSHSHSHSQSASPPRPTTPRQADAQAQAAAGAEVEDGNRSARGRSFRDIVMS